jgi:ATP adenylyltransferase
VDRLWSPWRAAYVQQPHDEPAGCLFCELAARGDDEAAMILHRGELAFVLMNAYPYNPGHLMVAPFRHVGDLEALEPDEVLDAGLEVQRAVRALREAMSPDGYNLGMNLGRVAGAGIPDHVHWHVVPRWNGDTNFMPVLGETRVLPESVEDTYRKLRPRFGTRVELVPSDPEWPARYRREADRIAKALGPTALRIEHVGSTSVPGLAAKPVIDIQVSVASFEPSEAYAGPLSALGYEHDPDPEEPQHRIFGLSEDGRHRFHVHVCEAGSDWEGRHLGFREALRSDPDLRARYLAEKRRAAGLHPNDSLAYAEEKTAFIRAEERRLGLPASHPPP